MNEEDIELFDTMILEGSIEVDSLDANGDFLYRFTELGHKKHKDMLDAMTDLFMIHMAELADRGYISIDKETTMVNVLPNALDEDLVDELPSELKKTLMGILDILRIK